MKYIDIENWSRKGHFEFFYRMDYPQYNICMDIDITKFLAFTKKEGLPFYYSMIYAATVAVNDIENLKYRIRDGRVVLHDTIHPSFTDMDSNNPDELFKMVTLDLEGSIKEFTQVAAEVSKGQHNYFGSEKDAKRDDLIYITSIPWISFTHMSHTISLNRNEAVPRISWGKYYKNGEKTLLPFSVQVHHALVDGLHVGRYVERLQQYMDTFTD